VSVKGRQGIDEAWSRLTPAQAVAAGVSFVIGYVSYDPSKNITPAEIDAYHAAGIGVLLIWEYSITAAEGGSALGHSNAAAAIAQARAAGYPQVCALGFAIDEDETPHPSNITGYARAFTTDAHMAGYRTFIYGGLATVSYAADNFLADLLFQTYAWSTRNGVTVWDPRVAIRQVHNGVQIAGHDVDLDVAMVDDIGAWMPGNGSGQVTPEEHEWLRQVWSVVGSAYAQSAAAKENPVRDIGGQVWDLGTVLKDVQTKVAALPTGGVALTDDDRVLIANLTIALNAVSAHLR